MCTILVCVCTPVLLLYAVLVPTLLLFHSFNVLTEERVPGRLGCWVAEKDRIHFLIFIFCAPFIY